MALYVNVKIFKNLLQRNSLFEQITIVKQIIIKHLFVIAPV